MIVSIEYWIGLLVLALCSYFYFNKLIKISDFPWKIKKRDIITIKFIQASAILVILITSVVLVGVHDVLIREVLTRLHVLLLFFLYCCAFMSYNEIMDRKEKIMMFSGSILFGIMLLTHKIGFLEQASSILLIEMQLVATQVIYFILFLYLLGSLYFNFTYSIMRYIEKKTKKSFYITLLQIGLVFSFLIYLVGSISRLKLVFVIGKIGLYIVIFGIHVDKIDVT